MAQDARPAGGFYSCDDGAALITIALGDDARCSLYERPMVGPAVERGRKEGPAVLALENVRCTLTRDDAEVERRVERLLVEARKG